MTRCVSAGDCPAACGFGAACSTLGLSGASGSTGGHCVYASQTGGATSGSTSGS